MSARVPLYVPLQDLVDERFERTPVRRPHNVGEHDRRVDDRRVDHAQSSQIVFQPMADEYRVRRDEAHQIILHVFQQLRPLVEVFGRDARESRIVVDDEAFGADVSVVDEPAVVGDDADFRQFEAGRRVAHLAVESVDAVVAVDGGRLPGPRADVAVKGAVLARIDARPDVQFGRRAALRELLGLAAGVEPVFAARRGPHQFAPVVHAVLLRQIFAGRRYEETLLTSDALLLFARHLGLGPLQYDDGTVDVRSRLVELVDADATAVDEHTRVDGLVFRHELFGVHVERLARQGAENHRPARIKFALDGESAQEQILRAEHVVRNELVKVPIVEVELGVLPQNVVALLLQFPLRQVRRRRRRRTVAHAVLLLPPGQSGGAAAARAGILLVPFAPAGIPAQAARIICDH